MALILRLNAEKSQLETLLLLLLLLLLLFYGLWRHLDIELLNANPVHHVGTAKERAVDRTPAAYRYLAVIPHLACA